MEEESVQNSALWCWTKLGIIVAIIITIYRTSKFVRFYSSYIIYPAYLAVFAVISIPFLLLNPWKVENTLYVTYFLRYVSIPLGMTVELRDCEIHSQDRGGVVVANHRSYLDLVGMCHIWGVWKKAVGVAKNELFYLWPFGLVFWLIGTVFLDRANSSKAKQQLNKAARMMKDDKVKLVMYAEGTRNRTAEPMLPFKKGPFRIAIECQVPIFPIVYSPYYFINHETMEFKSGTIVMQALPPIETAGLTLADIDDVMERARKIMLKTIIELNEEMCPNFVQKNMH